MKLTNNLGESSQRGVSRELKKRNFGKPRAPVTILDPTTQAMPYIYLTLLAKF